MCKHLTKNIFKQQSVYKTKKSKKYLNNKIFILTPKSKNVHNRKQIQQRKKPASEICTPTFFGFVSREKKLEGIARYQKYHTHTHTNRCPRANAALAVGQYLGRDHMQREACSFWNDEQLDFFILQTNKKSSRHWCAAQLLYSVCERKQTSKKVQASLLLFKLACKFGRGSLLWSMPLSEWHRQNRTRRRCCSRSPICCVHAKLCLPRRRDSLPYSVFDWKDSSCVCVWRLSSMIARKVQHKS